jgi:hypothetical protein
VSLVRRTFHRPLVFATIAVVSALMPAQVSAAGSWTVQAAPAPQIPGGYLQAIACPSADVCESAGFSFDAGGQQRPAANGWNGTIWTSQNVPEPSKATLAFLDGVSCASPNACMAVGGYATVATTFFGLPLIRPLAEWWDGKSWSMTSPIPFPSGKYHYTDVTGVACGAKNMCIAVGSYQVNSSSGDFPNTWSALWNGKTWKLLVTPTPASSSSSTLNAVSCANSSSCFAIGNYNFGGIVPTNPLFERWNGSVWTVQTGPTPVGAQRVTLNGISCAGDNVCIAVGGYSVTTQNSDVLTLAVKWNGSKWQIQSTPTPAGTLVVLSGVSCAASKSCTAVWWGDGSLVEGWNGSVWSVQHDPTPSGSVDQLKAISCHSPAICSTAGERYNTKSGAILDLVERHGTSGWTPQQLTTPTGAYPSTILEGATCRASTCVAVGASLAVGTQQQNLAETWDGTAWTIQSMPSIPGGTDVALSAISCGGASSCMAAGSYVVGNQSHVLAEMWDGSSWNVEILPVPAGALTTQLSGVSCSGPKACTAVGWYSTSTTISTALVERWNGIGWSMQTTANPTNALETSFQGVSCSGPNVCLAVGKAWIGGAFKSLAEIWNGSSWSVDASQDPGGARSVDLDDVFCSSQNECTAVGSFVDTNSVSDTLVERWNGTNWTIQPTPDATTIGGLNQVSCDSSTACTAISSSTTERWDGFVWTIQAPAIPNGGQWLTLAGVACSTQAGCLVAGSFTRPYIQLGFGGTELPLIERG